MIIFLYYNVIMKKNIINILYFFHNIFIILMFIIPLIIYDRYKLYFFILIYLYLITGWIICDGCWFSKLETYYSNKEVNHFKSFAEVFIEDKLNIKINITTIRKIVCIYMLFVILFCIYKLEFSN